jgi:hypothetical protein
MLTYANLKAKSKTFLSVTGLTPGEFLFLFPVFSNNYQTKQASHTLNGKPRQRKPGGGVKGSLCHPEDKLLFILVYLKTYPLQTLHGAQFGLSQPQTNFWIHRLLPLAQHALADLGLVPARDPKTWASRPIAAETALDVILDGTERRRQRPRDADQQQEHYSGKKKAHTDKNLVLVSADTGVIRYLGQTHGGRHHDKSIADAEDLRYPVGTLLGKDTGFQGYEPMGVLTYQPKKKPKGRELSPGDKGLNRILCKTRIRVEHAIAGIKRSRIVKEILRNTKPGFSDAVMEVACALHNLRVSFRHPRPLFNVWNLAPENYSR